MKKITITRKATFALFALLFAWNSYCQLPPFTLNATATPQTCTGNGSISFTTTGTAPGATLSYALYLLPNTTDPVTLVSASPINSLAAGNYLLVATQSSGAESNQSTANVTILNQAVPLVYNLAPTHIRCGNDGKITVNVTAGTAISYEITAGPVTAPLQSSNVFNNLPVGQYQVRVHDNCGDALVVSIQLTAATPMVVIGPGTSVGGELPSCNTVTVRHAFSTTTGAQIFYPLTLEYTVFPPGGGAPVIVTNTLASGGSGIPSFNVFNNIPFYNDQAYSYNLKVTDACGNVYVRNNNSILPAFDVSPSPGANCDDLLFTLFPTYFVGPFTVNFTNSPAGFDPEDFSVQHPIFTDGMAIYAVDGLSVPSGSYTAQITDACGRTVSKTFEVVLPEITPQVTPQAIGCTGLGSIDIEVPGRTIDEIEITIAPAGYPDALPDDVATFITEEGWFMEGLPLGNYTIVLVDSCGETHTVETEIEFSGSAPELQVLQRPGCEEGFGSVRLRNPDSGITAMTITVAPAAFTGTLPYNASANIGTNGMLYINSLPAGSYTANFVDQCGVAFTESFVVEGYNIVTNELDIIAGCNSFQLDMEHSSNGNYIQSFWLQQLDPDTNTWKDPDSAATYTEGTLPNAANSQNVASNVTYQATGIFRILKVFYVYSNGTIANERCITEIHNFEFIGRPVIHAVYGFPCSDGLSEVAVEATGLAPLTYEITHKDGQPFVVNNGTSNIFSGLEPGTYNFRVTDACGSFANSPGDINELDPIAIESQNLCEGESGLLSVPAFTFLNYEWYEISDPTTILATTNTLSLSPFNSTIHPGTYAVRIYSANPSSCIDSTVEFVVEPNSLPVAGADEEVIICNEGATLDLDQYLTGQDAGGTWIDTSSTGALTGDMFNTDGVEQGIYFFTYSVEGDCDIIDEAILKIDLRDIPAMPVTTAVAALCEGSDIQLTVATVADAVYQWTGPNNFTSAEQNPLITAVGTAASGEYSVTVTVNGCTSDPAVMNINVNALPQFTVTGNTSLCNGQTSQLDVVGQNFNTGDASYEWYYEGVLQPANTGSIIIDQTGTYEVTVTTNGICQSVPYLIEVTENTAAFEVVLEHGCRDFEYFITVVSPETSEEAAYTYEWEGPDGYLNSGAEINITDGAEGTYTVTVGNAEGCTTTAFADITNSACRIQKGISPGDAEHNNSFDLSQLDVLQLQIYNRYGLEVYEKANYKDEWHGQGKGGDLPTGTYYYVVSLSTGTRVTGWVYINRQN